MARRAPLAPARVSGAPEGQISRCHGARALSRRGSHLFSWRDDTPVGSAGQPLYSCNARTVRRTSRDEARRAAGEVNPSRPRSRSATRHASASAPKARTCARPSQSSAQRAGSARNACSTRRRMARADRGAAQDLGGPRRTRWRASSPEHTPGALVVPRNGYRSRSTGRRSPSGLSRRLGWTVRLADRATPVGRRIRGGPLTLCGGSSSLGLLAVSVLVAVARCPSVFSRTAARAPWRSRCPNRHPARLNLLAQRLHLACELVDLLLLAADLCLQRCHFFISTGGRCCIFCHFAYELAERRDFHRARFAPERVDTLYMPAMNARVCVPSVPIRVVNVSPATPSLEMSRLFAPPLVLLPAL